MGSGSCWDQWGVCRLFAGYSGRSGFEAKAVISGFRDVKAVSKAMVIFASPNTKVHSPKLGLVVVTTLVRSYSARKNCA